VDIVVKRIAIIPARGGSKRIKNKNLINFFGKPLIAWTILAAIKSNLFNRVLVSTDSKTIARISKKYGAEVPFLRKKYYDDITPVSKATINALKYATMFWKEKYDVVVQLMPNCPLRNSMDIKKSLEVFEKKKRNLQISCFRFGWMNPWWSFIKNKNGRSKPLFPSHLKKRSQDLPILYCPTGAIWVAKTEKLIKSKTFYGKDYCFEELDWISSVDIDDYNDLKFAKILKENKKDIC